VLQTEAGDEFLDELCKEFCDAPDLESAGLDISTDLTDVEGDMGGDKKLRTDGAREGEILGRVDGDLEMDTGVPIDDVVECIDIVMLLVDTADTSLLLTR
jgi:hypothetical protein